MDFSLLLRGMLLGISIAAPVGPIGLLCIRRTLADGRVTGLVSGLGAATADLLYGCIAAFGLTAITGALTGNTFWLRLIGGAFLLVMGIGIFRASPASRAAETTIDRRGLLGAYLSTLLLTASNPTTIFSFAAIFAATGGANTSGDYGASLLVAGGVFLGSAAWWLMLSGGVSLLRNRFDEHRLRLVNRISGVMIIAFGLVAIGAALF
jgi:threonine/homoserine/homoserine lactone efflux protein